MPNSDAQFPSQEIADVLGHELGALEVPVDVIVVSEEHAAKWAAVKGTMINVALGEGRLVAQS
jgi:hypothetical protein